SPKKQSFGPASLTAGSRPEVTKSPISHPEVPVSRPEARATSGSRPEVEEESSNDTSSASDGDPPATTTFDITIPGPVSTQIIPLSPSTNRYYRTTPAIIVSRKIGPVRLDWTRGPASPACLASAAPPRRSNATLHLWDRRPNGPKGSLPPAGHVPRHLPLLHPMLHLPPDQGPKLVVNLVALPKLWPSPAATTPQVQSCGRSKTITTKKTPAPAPAPAPVPAPVPAPAPAVRSSSVAVPRAALNVPMPDLHSMAIAIRDGAAHIAILEARVQEQDAKIDTLQRLHESLRRTVVDRHPSFSLPDTPADGLMLLDQGGPMVEPTQVQPEGPQSSGEIVLPDEPGNLLPEFPGDIVVPNEPGNLLPEYDSSDEEMDVEGKNLKLQIEVDITRNPNTRMSNYQCRTPSPGCRVPSPDTWNSGFDILDERHLPDMFKSTYTYRVPSSGHPIPETRQSRFPVSGVQNSELGMSKQNILQTWTYRVLSSGHPKPETCRSRVSGVRNSELNIPSSEFWTPETGNPRLPGLGYRVSGTRNSVVPSSGHPKPKTRQSRVSGFGVWGWYISVWGVGVDLNMSGRCRSSKMSNPEFQVSGLGTWHPGLGVRH
ncbi:hypothetical protein EV424DRAFT_1356762, partial [Suillus variegatus]